MSPIVSPLLGSSIWLDEDVEGEREVADGLSREIFDNVSPVSSGGGTVFVGMYLS